MADKDINERNRISEILNVPILICLFHALKSFKREMGTLKLASDVKNSAKSLFEKMCYAQSENDFKENERMFLSLESPSLVAYYKTHWQPIAPEWVKCFKSQNGNFLNIRLTIDLKVSMPN